MAHTPGPWSINLDPATNYADSDKLSIEGSDYFIAQVDQCASQKENAALIAASPDLLSACIQSRALFCTLLGEEQDLPVSVQNLTKINVLSTKIGVLSLAIGKAQGAH